jgi:hypothetical protein
MIDGRGVDWYASMLSVMARDARDRLGPDGAMLTYLLEMALMEAREMAAKENSSRTKREH